MQGDLLEAYKVLSRSFLPHVEDQAYGTRGQVSNCYCLEV